MYVVESTHTNNPLVVGSSPTRPTIFNSINMNKPSLLGVATTHELVAELLLRIDTKHALQTVSPNVWDMLYQKVDHLRFDDPPQLAWPAVSWPSDASFTP